MGSRLTCRTAEQAEAMMDPLHSSLVELTVSLIGTLLTIRDTLAAFCPLLPQFRNWPPQEGSALNVSET